MYSLISAQSFFPPGIGPRSVHLCDGFILVYIRVLDVFAVSKAFEPYFKGREQEMYEKAGSKKSILRHIGKHGEGSIEERHEKER